MSKVSNVDEAEITNNGGFSFCAPLIPGARSRALVQIIRPKIILLDGSEIQTAVNIYSNAKTLLLKVCAYLKISDSESEIFGLYFRDIHNRKVIFIFSSFRLSNVQSLEFFFPTNICCICQKICKLQVCLVLTMGYLI